MPDRMNISPVEATDKRKGIYHHKIRMKSRRAGQTVSHGFAERES